MARPKTDENPDLDKCKLPELKAIARTYGLSVTGKKEIIKQRILEHLRCVGGGGTAATLDDETKHTCVRRLQSIFRGNMVRRWMHLKHTAKTSPVNDTDFYTLEPLSEMDFLYYIDYVDEKHNVSYVFNINSLMNLLVKTGSMVNPYTRDKFDSRLLFRAIEIIHYTGILFPGSDIINYETISRMLKKPVQMRPPALPIDPNANYATLINELFMKIDELGNYTNVRWFNNLSNEKLCSMMMRLCHMWNRVDAELRRQICPIQSPFAPNNLGIEFMNDTNTLQENRALVIRIGETMVYDGIDEEHKKLGAMYFLTGLTMVSMQARNQMPWLYDNYFMLMR